MRLISLDIKHFGKYSDMSISLGEGMNVIYGENEAGKTTIYTFIKSMLYGLERSRGRAALTDTFTQYEPWENPNHYAGELRFECGGKTFCLTRNFDKYAKKAELICEEDGEVLSVENGDLQMLLEGMDENSFENTVSIGQLKAETNQTLASELKNYAVNYYLTGNGDLDLEAALLTLSQKKKGLEKELKETYVKRQEKREVMEQELSYLWRDIHHFERELSEVEEKIKAVEQQERVTTEAGAVGSKWRVHPVEIAGMLTAIVLTFILFSQPWNSLIAIVVALAEGLYIWNRMKEGKRSKGKEKVGEGTHEIPLVLEKLLWHKERLEGELKDKETAHSNLQEDIEELQEISTANYQMTQKKQALDMAAEYLKSFSMDIHKQLSVDLNKRASQILKEITLGRYEKLLIDESLRMELYKDGKVIGIERVSRGTIEQIYFALRMAAAELLYTEEFPIILDDTFVFYDERRLEATLGWLVRNKKQVIILTCQKREQEALLRLGISYKRQELFE